MITLLMLGEGILCPDAESRDRFDASQGWSIEELGFRKWRVARTAMPEQNLIAVEAFTLHGYRGITREVDDAPEVQPAGNADVPVDRRGRGGARKVGKGAAADPKRAEAKAPTAPAHPLDALLTKDRPTRPEL